MKKTIVYCISVIMLLLSLSVISFAEEETSENVALKGIAYSSSEKNTMWTPAKSINNGLSSNEDWHGWECKYPSVIVGQDTSSGFSGEYCGIRFINREYYEISSVKMNVGLHSLYGNQNVKYKIEFLVEGRWVEVAVLSDSDSKPTDYDSYAEAMEKDKSNYHISAYIEYTLDTPITTNNVRITVSEYAKNYPGGDVLIFPYIYEVELFGELGETPDLELPEGAVISTNIAYNSNAYVSSNGVNSYAYLAIDGKDKTSWSPKKTQSGEYYAVEFYKKHTVNKIVLNFGQYIEGSDPVSVSFDVEAYIDSQWVKLFSSSSFDRENETSVIEKSITPTETTAIRLILTENSDKKLKLYEFETHIEDEQTYYLDTRFTTTQVVSASKGNLAVAGTSYASTNFLPYSEIYYINDGKYYEGSPVWFTGGLEVPEYCGIKLDKKYNVTKVALYFEDAGLEGKDSMAYEIQALVNGEYVKVCEGKTYDSVMKYSPVFEFKGVMTDEIRIVFTKSGSAFPHLRELEIYSGETVSSLFSGITKLDKQPQVKYEEAKAQNPLPSGINAISRNNDALVTAFDWNLINKNKDLYLRKEIL